MRTLANGLGTVVRSRAGRLLVCYLPHGDPATPDATARLYADHGVDVLEVGVAGGHALLDGPVVSASMERATAAGCTGTAAAERLAADLGDVDDSAAVWMSYQEEPGAAYLDVVASSGAGGVLLPDADQLALVDTAAAAGLAGVPFLSHAPTEAEVAAARRAEGYVMLAAADGVTGHRDHVAPGNAATIARLREQGVTAPVLLGFGLSTGDHVRAALAMGADGVIVGSACVRAAEAGRGALVSLLSSLRTAVDGA
ncbi:tryptophan synthase alpha chain [Nocardioides zeae]|uniref:Tryptophan synthase alpha chain n=2 Tax=Nocardioides zeae TaxID=1457234 RepID=A0ACC6ILN0_9ACTN|nr:tryptophan synthase subunit alpha [Nocardioides zeae]MDQ1105210.1 tryptophan synthase alpha chain [Nocardioides zeae]MDR6175077.1 tryptophan synthase alpha chain [Nocardioides zeae]MDR6211655.1 tryptophan synthase alpha chain [Nocardioides zeae]